MHKRWKRIGVILSILTLTVTAMLPWFASTGRAERPVPLETAAANDGIPVGNGWEMQFVAAGDLKDVSFPDSQHGWAVGSYRDLNGGFVMFTEDGGKSWGLQPTGDVRRNLNSVSFVDDDHGWAVGTHGTILHTPDGGKTWATQASGVDADLYGVDFADVQNGWAVGFQGLILHTSDGGVTWQSQSSGTTSHLYAVSAVDAQNAWVVGANGKVLHTSDGGTTWAPQTSGTGEYLYGVRFISQSVGWAAGARGIVVRTTDGGTTWTPGYVGQNLTLRDVTSRDGHTVWVVGDGNAFFTSTDGGYMWSKQTVGNGLKANYAIAAPGDTDIFVVGTFGRVTGIWKSSDNGSSWKLSMGGVSDLQDVKFVDKQHGWAVGATCLLLGPCPGAILRTVDGGRTWSYLEYPDPKDSGYFNGVDFVDENEGWVAGRYGVILHTTDGGDTWERQYSGTSIPLWKVTFLDHNRGWIGANHSSNDKLLKTTDGGKHWQRVDVGWNLNAIGSYFVSEDHGWVVSNNSLNTGVARYTERKDVWKESSVPYARGFRSVFFADSDNGWIVGDDGLVLFSSDSGASYEKLDNSGTHAHLMDVYALNTMNVYAVGAICTWKGEPESEVHENCADEATTTVIRSTNGGNSWDVQTLDVSALLRAVYFVSGKEGTHSEGWAVGDKGIILHVSTPTTLRSFETSRPPVVDGSLYDWAQMPHLTLDADTADSVGGVVPTPDDASATLRSYWSGNVLYLAIDVTDDVSGSGDAVLLGIDGRHDRAPGGPDDHSLAIYRDGTVLDAGTPVTTVLSAVQDLSGGYQVELALPASFLGVSGLSAGQSIGMSLGLSDDDGSGVESTLILDGNTTSTSSNDYGTLRLQERCFVLQSGYRDYYGLPLEPPGTYGDTYLDQLEPDTTHDDTNDFIKNALRIRKSSGSEVDPILWFDLSFLHLPTSGKVVSATFSLYTTKPYQSYPQQSPLRAGVFKLNREWTSTEATWNQASQGNPWSVPGANGVPDDRDDAPVDIQTISHLNEWFTWDVTSILQSWLSNPDSMKGLLVKPLDENDDFRPWYVVSADASLKHMNEDPVGMPKGPKIAFCYELEPPPTPTPTPTATFTPTPTATPTPSVGVVTGMVWEDRDMDGQMDPGEIGLPGAGVSLWQDITEVVSSTVGSSGMYTFTVSPGEYQVKESDPPGYYSSTPNEIDVHVSAGETVHANFGDYPPVKLYMPVVVK